MADNLKISSNVTAIVEVNETINGEAHSIEKINSFLGSIGVSFGYDYNSAESVLYKDIVWTNTTSGNNTTWTDATDFEGSADPYGAGTNEIGSITAIKGIGVKVKKGIGSSSKATLEVIGVNGTVSMVGVGVGEGFFVPFQGGIALADLNLKVDAYTNSTDELTIDLLIIGE